MSAVIRYGATLAVGIGIGILGLTMLWGQLKTPDWVLLAQTLVLTFGFLFTVIQIRNAARSSQATMIDRLNASSRELHLRMMEDPDLAPLSISGSTPDEVAEKKRDRFLGFFINYYATAFDVYRLGQIPADLWDALVADGRQLFENRQVREKWKHVERLHTEPFKTFVNTEFMKVMPEEEIAAERREERREQ